MTQIEFKEILSNEPTLTSLGFEGNSHNDDFKNKRKQLEESFEECKTCSEWIDKYKTRFSRKDLKEFNFLKFHLNSYYLKHAIEKWSGIHISNGALIAALIYHEVRFKPIFDSPDVLAVLPLKKDTPYI